MYFFFYIQRFDSSQADLETSHDAYKIESCCGSKHCMNRKQSCCFQQLDTVLAVTATLPIRPSIHKMVY